MKTLTYAAAIALLTASAAFAQSSSNNSSMMNNSTPTPSMSGPSEGNGGTSSQSANSPSDHSTSMSGSMSDHNSSASGSMSGDQSKASSDMDQSKASSDMDQSKASSDMDKSKASDHASMQSNEKTTSTHHVASEAKAPRHIASRGSAKGNARENQETAQLNRQQISGSAMNEGMSANMAGTNGMHRNPFNNGSPQQAQAGGANCTPDRPDCGTARQNPAINSSPQQRTYNAAPH